MMEGSAELPWHKSGDICVCKRRTPEESHLFYLRFLKKRESDVKVEGVWTEGEKWGGARDGGKTKESLFLSADYFPAWNVQRCFSSRSARLRSPPAQHGYSISQREILAISSISGIFFGGVSVFHFGL